MNKSVVIGLEIVKQTLVLSYIKLYIYNDVIKPTVFVCNYKIREYFL